MKVFFHQALFVLASAVAGFLSGLMMPLAFGVRGAILAAALSVGAAVLNPWRHGDSARCGIATICTTIVIVATAFLAFGLMVLWESRTMWTVSDELGFSQFRRLPALVACLAYSAALLIGYRMRHLRGRVGWAWFAVAPVAGAIARNISVYSGLDEFFVSLLYGLGLGSLPFVALWLIVARIADPAWTRERWMRRVGAAGRPVQP